MKIPEILFSKSAQFAREARRIRQARQTVPLAAEKGGVIGDTFEIRNHSMKLKKIWIKEAEKEEIIECLRNKMMNRSDKVQELYQTNIDFVNKKLNKQKYLDEMDYLLQNTKAEVWGKIDEGEENFIGIYNTFFDFHGVDADCITKSCILSDMAYLI